MDKEKQALLEALRDELNSGRELDPEARELLRDIHSKIEEGTLDSALDRARQLDADFAARHPQLERLARMVLDSLGKMGI